MKKLIGLTLLLSGCMPSIAWEPHPQVSVVIQKNQGEPLPVPSVAPSSLSSALIFPASYRFVRLKAKELGARVTLWREPGPKGAVLRYEMDGDSVKILEQIQSEEGVNWYKVECPDEETVGWVHGDFVNFE